MRYWLDLEEGVREIACARVLDAPSLERGLGTSGHPRQQREAKVPSIRTPSLPTYAHKESVFAYGAVIDRT